MLQPTQLETGDGKAAVKPAPAAPVQAEQPRPLAATKKPWLRKWLYRIVSLLVIGGVSGGLYWSRHIWLPKLDAFVRPNANVEKPKPRPPLVTVVEAEQVSVPQYINCLGTVTAFNSVVVRSRVDGELIEVAIQEGEMVKAGQLLARIDPRTYQSARDQAAGQLERDKAAMELARLNFDRTKKVTNVEVLSQQEIDEARAAYQQAQSTVDVSKSLLDNAELQLAYTDVLAPISGRIGLRLVDKGNIVKASDTNGLLVITQLQPISVVFPIPQDEIPRVSKRLAETKATDVLAFDRSFKTLLSTGKLTALDNQVDSTTGTLRLKATFDNEAGSLFPNQFVNVRLLVQSWDNAIVVPTSAVQRGPDFMYVYVVGEESTVDVQKVTVAFSEGGKSVIESGLSAGQKVVTEGTDRLQPKGKVTLPGAQQGPPGSGKERPAGGPASDKSSTGEKAAEKPADKPTEKPVEKPNSDTPADKSAEKR